MAVFLVISTKMRKMIMNTTKILSNIILAACVLPLAINAISVDSASSTKHHHLTSSTIGTQFHKSKNVGITGNVESILKQNNVKKFKLVQVQIIHRHGDRTPITPMKDESYWSNTLPSQTLLSKIASGTNVIRNNDQKEGCNHTAGGRGPFGKLTQLGLLQMVEVGSSIREQLQLDGEEDDNNHHVDEEGHIYLHKGCLFTNKKPLHPTKIKVKSTDFPRTLQSVQALLVGLFPDGLPEGTQIDIDARHTDVLIPDPQPRMSAEQVELEKLLSQREHVLHKEAELKTLALKISNELKSFISDDANSAVFGIGEDGDSHIEERPISWSQLKEIMTCLKVRGILPASITDEEYELMASHVAWKWFESLRHQKLAYLAMKPFMNFIMNTLYLGQKLNEESISLEEPPTLHIYSAHDSSLIGLICAFRLQKPSHWPDYGSYLKIELFEAHDIDDDVNKEYYVRFSLNNNVLKSTWGVGDENYLEPKEMIPLHHLDSSIKNDHGH